MTLALPYLYLAVAIIFEVIGTSASKSVRYLHPPPSKPCDRGHLRGILPVPRAEPADHPGWYCLRRVGRPGHCTDCPGWMALVQAAARRACTDRACPNHQRGHYGKCVLRVPPALAHWTALKRARSLRSAIHSMDDTDGNRQVCWSSRRKG